MIPSATQRAVDEKFCALEQKEQELQQLRVSVRERGSDLERLRSVLSSNEATIHVSAGTCACGNVVLDMLWGECLQVFGFLWPPVWGKFLGHSCFWARHRGHLEQMGESVWLC